MMKRFSKKENLGITLIALVITIIILLILAGITISQISNNGLFDKSKQAKEQYQNAQYDENDKIAKYKNEINSYIGGNRDYKPINYSTEEQDTGIKWIDGNSIYQKLISITLPSDGNWKTVATLENVKNYIEAKLLYIDMNTYRSTPYMQFTIRGDNNGNNLDIKAALGNSTWYNKTAYIVVNYTK